MIRVVIADDIPLFRQMVVDTLEEEEDVAIVGQDPNGRIAVRLCQELHPDIILLDVEMPLMNGVEATREIVAGCPETRVVILTAYEEDSLIVQLIQAGATGYVLKDTPMEEVVRAIRVAHGGESLIQPRVAQKILKMFAGLSAEGPLPPRELRGVAGGGNSATGRDLSLLDRLTAREKEILVAIARGRNNKELAEIFQIGGTTVKTHVARVMQKLEGRDRVDLVLFAVQAGLVEEDS